MVIDKVNNGGNDADAFNFDPSAQLSGSDFTVSESGNAASFTVAPNIGAGSVANSYTVSETDLSAGNQPAGYRLTGISCPSNGAGGSTNVAGNELSGSADVKVAAGNTVTCTFTNTKNATIVVDKAVIGGDPDDEFNFDPSADIAGNDFLVSQSGNPASFEVAPNIGAGSANKSYTVDETDLSAGNQPAGYRLTDIDCAGNGQGGSDSIANDALSGTADVKVAAGGTVTCTFTNTKNGKVEIAKINNAGPASDSFSYDASAALSGDFSLQGGQVQTVSNVTPNTGPGSVAGSYTVTEGPTGAGYRLTALSCDDGDSTGSTSTRTATLNVEAGETVRCTFTNGFSAPGIAIDKSGPANATAGDLLPYTIVVTNPGQEPLTGVAVTDPQCTTAPALQTKNRGDGVDGSPDTLDPGDSWVYTCSGQTQNGQTSYVNQACVEARDEFGRVVNACDDVNTVLAQQQVLGDQPIPGQARLAGRSGCVAKVFYATVRGRQIEKVVFRIDGKKRATLTRADSRGRYRLRVNPRAFKPGSHLLVARTTFVEDSGTAPKTMRLRFQRCVKRTAPAFTG